MQDEIVARINASTGFLNFSADVLLPFLDFEHAQAFLKPEVTAAEWEQKSQDRDAILADMRDYMAFAWGKVEDHRGLSAGRSVDKIAAWAWLLDDDVAKRMVKAGYAQYGAPKLAVACEAFGFPIPDKDGIRNMIAGQQCVWGCGEGCGQ